MTFSNLNDFGLSPAVFNGYENGDLLEVTYRGDRSAGVYTNAGIFNSRVDSHLLKCAWCDRGSKQWKTEEVIYSIKLPKENGGVDIAFRFSLDQLRWMWEVPLEVRRLKTKSQLEKEAEGEKRK